MKFPGLLPVLRQSRRAALALLLSAVALASPLRAQQPQQGDQIVIALAAPVATLDPHMTATLPTDLSVISHLYSPLIIRGPDLQLQPAIATSWQATDDRTWRFELRSGVTFPNGEALDAAAVKWNIDRVIAPDSRMLVRPWLQSVQEARVVSPTTVEIVTREPFPALADQLSMFFLLPPQWGAANNPARVSMGTGLYDLREFVPGDRIVLEAKASHWSGQVAPFRRVVFRMVPEASSRVAAVLAGEVDVGLLIPPSEIARINASGRARAGSVPTIRTMMVKLNLTVAPLRGNRALRQALNYAVDRQAIIRTVLAGLTTESQCQVLTPGYFGFNPALRAHQYDPARARQLLREAGFPNGLELEFEVPVGGYLLGEELSQAIAAQLEEVGVRVRLVEIQYNRWLSKFRTEGNLGQMAYLGFSWPTLDADGLLTLFQEGNSYSYWPDSRFAQLVTEARSTTNRERRQDLYRQATELFCNEAPVIFLFSQPFTYALSPRVEWEGRADEWTRVFDMRPRR